MLLPDYLDKLPDPLVTLFQQVEEDILEDMARRILKTGKLTDSAQWQAWRLEQLGEEKNLSVIIYKGSPAKRRGKLTPFFKKLARKLYIMTT